MLILFYRPVASDSLVQRIGFQKSNNAGFIKIFVALLKNRL